MEHKSIIVFDGVCHLCSGWVHFLIKRDPAKRFIFSAMQTATGKSLLSQHGLNPDDPVSFLLIDKSITYRDSTAIVHILKHLDSGWKVLAVLIAIIPRMIRDPLYRWFARNRYSLFGRRTQCLMPSAALRERFLE